MTLISEIVEQEYYSIIDNYKELSNQVNEVMADQANNEAMAKLVIKFISAEKTQDSIEIHKTALNIAQLIAKLCKEEALSDAIYITNRNGE